jgi:hypothetical protein
MGYKYTNISANVPCSFSCSVGRVPSEALTGATRVTYLASHWIGVDLTHIGATVVRLYVGDVQFPSVVAVVSDREPWVVSHHVCLNGENCLRVGLDPRHLHDKTRFCFNDKKQTRDQICAYLS